MNDIKTPKLNYDDFYKFGTSFSLIIFSISSFFEIYFLLNSPAPYALVLHVIGLTLMLGSASFFCWSLHRWFCNQKMLDRILKLNTFLKIAEYEKIIKELAKDEKSPLEQRIENTLSGSQCIDMMPDKIRRVTNRIEKNINGI